MQSCNFIFPYTFSDVLNLKGPLPYYIYYFTPECGAAYIFGVGGGGGGGGNGV